MFSGEPCSANSTSFYLESFFSPTLFILPSVKVTFCRAAERAYCFLLASHCMFLSQTLEIAVTARHLEREHHSQLKRWKKNRGELKFKSPPRMHGTRFIMLAEPPRRQDLQQNPTILVETPPPTVLKKSNEEKKSKKKSMKKPKPTEDIPNPYSLPSDSSGRPAGAALPLSVGSEPTEAGPNTPSDSPQQQQQAPPTDGPPAQESALQQSTQSLSSTEQDTYL